MRVRTFPQAQGTMEGGQDVHGEAAANNPNIKNCPIVFSPASVKRAPMNDRLNASASATVPLR